MHWQTSRFQIPLQRPQLMGIVNVTPDSFSDGGRYGEPSAALAHCERLLREGADILDIGGESTRPGARPPALDDELARVLPVLRHALTLGVPVSVDTSRPEVMAAALDLGVDIVNDVRALCQPGALAVVAGHARCGVCLMHLRGEPETMQQASQLAGHGLGDGVGDSVGEGAEAVAGDVVNEVTAWLGERLAAVHGAGVALSRIVVDPGIGFGKTHAQNWALLQGQRELLSLGRPLLVGWSRKSTLGELTGRAVDERLAASVAAALAAVQQGAGIVRVHDVAATVDALKVWRAAGLAPQ